MKKYSMIKEFDISSIKNAEENEIRTEIEPVSGGEFEYLNTKNIHNKGKKYK